MGLGIQQLLTERYSWALEYAYSTYGVLRVPTSAFSGTEFEDAIFSSTGMKPSTNSLIFMIAYRL
jgi:hypothetical protein